MLGNHADKIMNTPMVHNVTTQEQQAMNMEMPAPRPTSRVDAGIQFMPGIGSDQFMPGVGTYVSAPAYSGTAGLGNLPGGNLLLLGGAALAAWFLFMRGGAGRSVPAARRGAQRRK